MEVTGPTVTFTYEIPIIIFTSMLVALYIRVRA
jgi:hypothetical protein